MEPIKLNYTILPGDLSRAGEASSQMKMTLRQLGISPDTIRRASVCMYEGEINMVIHAEGGEAEVLIGMEDLTIRLADKGPGIPDLEKAMTPGWSTASDAARGLGFGAGMGLPNMKRCSDDMTVETTLGVGTTVTMKLHLS